MHLHVLKTTAELSNTAADWIASKIASTLESKERFTMALSGGSTPQQLHTLLANTPYKERIDWSRIHIFWGDERAVPFEDERNNARMAFDTLLNFVPVPLRQIHVMKTEISPDESAREYEQILHQYFDTTNSSFDLVILGMGDDGHTLSLFPGTDIIHEETAWTKAFFLDAQNMYRISLTAPVVNRSSAIVFLAAGHKKSKSLKEVLEGKFAPDLYPSQVIHPEKGELHWFVDEAAASELTR